MNCPNCGAPVTGRVCDYCGTVHAKESEQVTIVADYDYTIIRDWDGNEVYSCPIEEIVRCGDCVYFDKYENDEISVCYRFDNEEPLVEPDGFCAWGERKVVGE